MRAAIIASTGEADVVCVFDSVVIHFTCLEQTHEEEVDEDDEDDEHEQHEYTLLKA